MSDISNFNELMANVFRENWNPVPDDGSTYNYIGALSSQDDFKFFQGQFIDMVNDLKCVYDDNPQEIKRLVKTVRNVATKSGCHGAYSELCVLHALNYGGHFDIVTDITLKASESFAAQLGHRKDTNMDGYIPDFDIYFDTKSFRDTITPILRNVSSKSMQTLVDKGVLTEEQSKRVYIQYQFHHIDSEDKYQENIKALVDEFITKFIGLDKRMSHKLDKIKRIHSDIIQGLQYVFNWGGISSSESCYSPFERAEKLVEPLLVRYADKFLLHHPFMLILVNHPWFNQVDTDAFDFNCILYRALSRRVFMQFRSDDRKMSAINAQFVGEETIDEVSKHISAILYIDVLSAVDKGKPYKCYLYTNPRAINKIRKDVIGLPLCQMNVLQEEDDFIHDNY